MELEELTKKIEGIERDANALKKVAMREYCLANNKVNIGDIISDHIETIQVTAVRIYYRMPKPECIYEGIPLKKDGTPKKNGKKTYIYQQNMRVKP